MVVRVEEVIPLLYRGALRFLFASLQQYVSKEDKLQMQDHRA